jgi:hypothetical protein
VNGLSPPETTASAAYKSEYKQEDDRTYRGVDDRCDNASAEENAELWKKPTSDQCADNADGHVADKPKSEATNDLTGKPAGDQSNYKND